MKARTMLIGALISSCAKDATQLLVFVESDLSVPDELNMVKAIVLNDEGGIASEHTFPTTEVPLPFSFGVAPKDGPDDQQVTIELEAIGPSGSLFTRRTVTRFVKGKTVLLRMVLAKHCQGVSCEAGMTCTETGCASEEVSGLPEIEPGQESRLDASVVIPLDAGIEKSMILVQAEEGLTTSEAGGTATFTVELEKEPTSYVAIALSVSDPSEGAPSSDLLTFTPLDWNVPKIVTVTGLDDPADDGDQVYQIVTAPSVSGDPAFDSVDAPDVSLTNEDDDGSQIVLIGSEGLSTTERGGTASFSVVLGSQPANDVQLLLSSSDTGEATVGTATITFTTDDWDVSREVVITGVDDEAMDGPQLVTIRIDPSRSLDPAYAASLTVEVPIINTDDETAGVTVSPTAGLMTSEAGQTAQFSVVLNTEPSGPVTIGLMSSNPAEATVTPAAMTFDGNTWSIPQHALVTGVDDPIDDGDVKFTIVTRAAESSDPEYDGSDPSDVEVVNVDDEVASVEITPSTGLVTTELGDVASFAVQLTSAPVDLVTLRFTSSDPSEGSVNPPELNFDGDDWSTPKIVLITGADDSVVDGAVPYLIVTDPLTSNDLTYAGLDPIDVSVTNADNDSAGITVSPTAVMTTEAGGTASFTVRLNTAPLADVMIALTSNDTGEANVAPPVLTFNATNWSTPQTVTVTGVNDAIDDGDARLSVVTAQNSNDPTYANLDPDDVTVTNQDDDTAGFTVALKSGLVTTEAGGQAMFTVRLTSEPIADVTIGLSSSDNTEGTVAPMSLAFNGTNWSAPQAVIITGVNDPIDDGNVAYTIITAAATSNDPAYAGTNPPNVSVSNTDDDSAGILVSPASGLITRESGLRAAFVVLLRTQPTANVAINFGPQMGEVTLDVVSLTFTPVNWNMAQTVGVLPTDDNRLDGDQPYRIVVPPASSSDPVYSGRDPTDVTGTNLDDGTLLPTPLLPPIVNNQGTSAGSISGDGTVIAFHSLRNDLVSNDTNGLYDIFLYTRGTRTVTRISMGAGGTEANGHSLGPKISADGRWVVFASVATNLVPNDNNGLTDLFLYDRMTGTLTRTSLPMENSEGPGISLDGRYVPFSTDPVTGVFVFDRIAGASTLVSPAACHGPGISADGRYVVVTCGNDLIDPDSTPPKSLLFDRQGAAQGIPLGNPNGWTWKSSITPDSRHILYVSQDDPTVPNDTNGFFDVFHRDRITGAIEVVSVGVGGGANEVSEDPTASDDGRFILFRSKATNLVPQPPPSGTDNLWVRDRQNATTVFVASDVNWGPMISGNGRFVTYLSPGTDPSMLYLASRP